MSCIRNTQEFCIKSIKNVTTRYFLIFLSYFRVMAAAAVVVEVVVMVCVCVCARLFDAIFREEKHQHHFPFSLFFGFSHPLSNFCSFFRFSAGIEYLFCLSLLVHPVLFCYCKIWIFPCRIYIITVVVTFA